MNDAALSELKNIVIGQLITEHRKSRRRSVVSLALWVGVRSVDVRQWERGTRCIAPDRRGLVEEALGLDADTLLYQTAVVMKKIRATAQLCSAGPTEEDAWESAFLGLCGVDAVRTLGSFWAALVVRSAV